MTDTATLRPDVPPPDATQADEHPEEPTGTEAFVAAVARAVAGGASTPYEVDRAIEDEWPGFLDGRRGYVHAALLELRRRGAVTRSDDGGGAAFAPPGERRTAPTAAPVATSRTLLKLTTRVGRSLGFAPELRRTVLEDVSVHLAAIERETVEAGAEAGDAATAAARDFGDPWRIATDLRRTALGRGTVLFPRGIVEALAGLAIYDAGVLLLIVGAIVFVRLQIFTAYHIPTRSMEPTLHGDRNDGDRILVNRLSGAPDRWEIAVFDGWGAERKNYVKRCVALPNERFKIREGDIYVNETLLRKDGDLYESLLFPLYDWDDVRARAAAAGDDERVEHFYDEHNDLWVKASGEWLLHIENGYSVDAGTDGTEAVLRWDATLQNDNYEPDTGRLSGGYHECPDLRITSDVTWGAGTTRLVVRLTRGASAYDAEIGPGGAAILVDGAEVARDAALVPEVDSRTRVRFAQVDRVLRLEVDGTLLRFDLPQAASPKLSAPSAMLSYRVSGGPVTIKPLRLDRDVYYTPDDGEDERVLGPHDYFMLGDNSENSQDSRRNGAVHRSRLVGKPVLIVWPPSRWRFPDSPVRPLPTSRPVHQVARPVQGVGAMRQNGSVAEHCFSVTLRRGGAVSTVVDVPDSFVPHTTPVVVLAHGAGVDMRHAFMETFASAIAERGVAVVRFQFPYMERAGGQRPTETDPFEVLADTYVEVVRASGQRTGSPPGPLFLGGKSLGARVASAICAQGKVRPTGLVFLGYSLHAAGKPDAARADHLRACKVPMLFVQGERDALCDIPLLRAARKRLGLAGSLHVVPGGDHSYGQPPKLRARELPEMHRAADVVGAFVRRCLARR